jgi:hypothetical protein
MLNLSARGDNKSMKKIILLAIVIIFSYITSSNSYAEDKAHIPEDKSHIKDTFIPDVRSQFFCGYCHVLTYPNVIKKAYTSWISGKHKDVRCAECHYPPEQLDYRIPQHSRIPRDEKEASEKKTSMEFIKTELEVLSRLVTVLNMEGSVTRTSSRLDDRSCTASRCHPATGRGKEGAYWTKKIEFAKYIREDKTEGVVLFTHDKHYDRKKWVEGHEIHCTSCHQRETEQKHFEVTIDKCTLCHFKNLVLNDKRAKCALCHEVPTKPLQKQKTEDKPDEKPITHKSLEEAKVPCESCHLHLIKGRGEVDKEKCLTCHDNAKSFAKDIIDKKLMHEKHVAAQTAHCFNCHKTIEHKKADFLDVARFNCSACHPDHHKYQKMLLAGTASKEVEDTPSLMFSVETNCLGCHKEKKVVKGEEVEHGSGKTCVACHTKKHEGMVKEWKDKTGEELKVAKEIEKEALDTIESAKERVSKEKLGEATALLEKGQEALRIVEYGGGVHNKKYSIMLLDIAMNHFEDAIDLLSEEE